MKTTRRRIPLHTQMAVGFAVGLVAGLIVHVTAPGAPWVETLTTYVTQPIGQIFLRLLFMLVLPLLFSALRSEEHTSELQSLMRISYAVFCLKKTNSNKIIKHYQKKRQNLLKLRQ